jgi:hypothetical protein
LKILGVLGLITQDNFPSRERRSLIDEIPIPLKVIIAEPLFLYIPAAATTAAVHMTLKEETF